MLLLMSFLFNTFFLSLFVVCFYPSSFFNKAKERERIEVEILKMVKELIKKSYIHTY